MAYKRKRVYAPRRAKRKQFKRRPRRRVRRSAITSTLTSGGRGIRPASRRVSRSAWNRELWRNTMFKTKYRSNAASTSIIPTLNTPQAVTITTIPAVDNGTARFYITGGGMVSHDQGAAIPTFNGDIVLRGGKIGLTIANSTLDDATYTPLPIRVDVYLIYKKRTPLVALPTSAALGWGPDQVPEFRSQYGKVLKSWRFLLKAGDVESVEARLKLLKFDIACWEDQAYGPWSWVIAHTCLDTDRADNDLPQFTWTRFFNVAFTADAIS